MDSKEFLDFLFYDDDEDVDEDHPTFLDWWDEIVNEYTWEDDERNDGGDDFFIIM